MKTNILPKNIIYFLDKYKQIMKGNANAVDKIQQSLHEFNKSRQGSKMLQMIEIFPYEDSSQLINNQLYIIRIKGKQHSYYQGRIITFYLLVFDTYPQTPPQIIAPYYEDKKQKIYKPFLHLNIQSSGKVCSLSNQKQKQYYINTTLKDILIQLQHMIYQPNISSSYHSSLFQCYKQNGDNSEYYKKLNYQATFLQSYDTQSDYESENQDDQQ